MQQALVAADLAPGTHVLDSGCGDSHLFTTAHRVHHIDVVGPPFGSYSRQHKAGEGYDLHTFTIDWEAQQAGVRRGIRVSRGPLVVIVGVVSRFGFGLIWQPAVRVPCGAHVRGRKLDHGKYQYVHTCNIWRCKPHAAARIRQHSGNTMRFEPV